MSSVILLLDLVNNNCYLQERGEPEQELSIKGTTNQGGTWFQIGNLTHHWISFHQFSNTYEAFYKRVKSEPTGEIVTYYRQEPQIGLLIFSFGEEMSELKSMVNDGIGMARKNSIYH